jgi:CRISPR system Cascade subunit CasC
MNSPKGRVYVDIHVIQTLPPSCVNRDDTGSPKTAVYGGVRRARVSSQAWKHAMREMFQESFNENELGKRTRLCVDWVAEKIISLDNTIDGEKAQKYAQDTINIASKDSKKPIVPKTKKAKKGEEESDDSKVLLFLASAQVEKIAELALDWIQTDKKPEKETVSQSLTYGCTVDIALFGRMVATAPDLKVDASAQVAHAISTHKVENEYDYFTAMDDRSPEDQPGAGMIGTVEFNSSTLYRYATVAVHDLKKNLGDTNVATEAVKEFIRSFVCSMPTGKQNTFANNTPPYAVMVTIRRNQPVNLVGAFETPIKIKVGGGGYQKKSTEVLAKYAQTVYEKFYAEPEKVFVTAINDELAGSGDSLKFYELLIRTEEVVRGFLQKAKVQA